MKMFKSSMAMWDSFMEMLHNPVHFSIKKIRHSALDMLHAFILGKAAFSS